MPLDLHADHLKIVREILRRYMPHMEIWAFGSRVRGTARISSDLDLCILSEKPLGFKLLGQLHDAFSDSSLPFRVDVVDWATTSASFRKIIERDRVVVQEGGLGDGGWTRSDWRDTTWGEVVTLEYGKAIRNYQNAAGEFPVYGTNGPIGWHTTPLWPSAGVVIGRKGAYRGVHYSNKPFFVIDTAFYLKPKGMLNMKWAYYCLLTYDINGMDSGSAIPSTSRDEFYKLPISLPNLNEQDRISDLLGIFDDRITLLRETNATLEAIAQALFKSWFVDFDPVHAKQQGLAPEGMDEATAALFPDSVEESELGLVPRGWRVGKISDLGQVICGKTPPTAQPENYGDDVPFITIPDMHNQLVVTSTNRSLSRLGANSQGKKYLSTGSICVSCIATPGLVVRVTIESQTNQQINTVIPFPYWGKAFPLFLLRRIGDAVRAGGSGGSVFHNLNKSGFEKLMVLLTSKSLAQNFDDIVEPLVTKIIHNQIQAQTLATLRDTLLPRLISGQLRLPEAEAMLEESGR